MSSQEHYFQCARGDGRRRAAVKLRRTAQPMAGEPSRPAPLEIEEGLLAPQLNEGRTEGTFFPPLVSSRAGVCLNQLVTWATQNSHLSRKLAGFALGFLALCALATTVARRGASSEGSSAEAGDSHEYKCSSLDAGRGEAGSADANIPVCVSSISGLSQVYELNPKYGTQFEGSEAIELCMQSCGRGRHLSDGQRPGSFREGKSMLRRSLLYANSGSFGAAHLEAHTAGNASGPSDLRLGRRLLQQQVNRDKERSDVRADKIETVGRAHLDGSMGATGLRVNARGSGAAAQIFGNVHPDGLYYIAVGIGTPPKTFFLDIDTGSRLTWVTCDAPCVSCARGPNGYYSPKNAQLVRCGTATCAAAQAGGSFQGCSSAHAGDQCDYDIHYGDGSSSQGVLVSDSLLFLHPTRVLKSTPFVFGCAYDQDGHLAQSPAMTDGILGLGVGPLSLPAQLSTGGFLSNVFGHCLSPGQAGGGYFFLGDSLSPSNGLTWVPLITVPGLPYYYVPLQQISVAGQLAATVNLSPLEASPQGSEGTVVDSGSSFSYLPTALFNSVFDAVAAEATKAGLVPVTGDATLPHCWGPPTSSGADTFGSIAEGAKYLPDIDLVFSGRDSTGSRMTLKPHGYLIRSDLGNLCLGILEGTSSLVLLGDVSLRGLLLVYDNNRSELGWIVSTCQRKS